MHLRVKKLSLGIFIHVPKQTLPQLLIYHHPLRQTGITLPPPPRQHFFENLFPQQKVGLSVGEVVGGTMTCKQAKF